MSEIKIEKGIEIPKRNQQVRPMRCKYPLLELEVGDSFFITGVKSGTISGTTGRISKSTGKKFTIRQVDGGIRVWRTE